MPLPSSRSSHEERGLKSRLSADADTTWLSRSSHEERGLKYCVDGYVYALPLVAPRMRSVD